MHVEYHTLVSSPDFNRVIHIKEDKVIGSAFCAAVLF
jgi:hypothetical protein